MAQKQDLPRLRRCQSTGKITAYPAKEIEELYHLGKGNGWDTPKMVRDAITDVLIKIAEDLKRPANDLT